MQEHCGGDGGLCGKNTGAGLTPALFLWPQENPLGHQKGLTAKDLLL